MCHNLLKCVEKCDMLLKSYEIGHQSYYLVCLRHYLSYILEKSRTIGKKTHILDDEKFKLVGLSIADMSPMWADMSVIIAL